MNKEKTTIKIGLMGAGTVGCGTLELLHKKRAQIAKTIGCDLEISKVLVRDPHKERSLPVKRSLLTTDAAAILHDPSIAVVVEVIGGEEPAYTYIKEALQRGKHVVTANKEVIAKFGFELLRLAEERRVNLFYEPSVAGGIPVIDVIRRGLIANEILGIEAILNATTNYILTKMSEGNIDFATALRQAQSLGYAEADPCNDIEGIDAAYKLAILSTLSFKTEVRPDDVYHYGIADLEAKDFRYAKEMGYVIKLLAVARVINDEIEAWVHPTFIPDHHHLAKVNDVFNAVLFNGDQVDQFMLYGPGAGAAPTASAVVADLCTIAHNLQRGVIDEMGLHRRQRSVRHFGDLESRHYIRMQVDDRPGVLAQISKVLGDEEVSIASVIQKETDETARSAELVFMTHPAKVSKMKNALVKIERLAVVRKVSSTFMVQK
ncbi:MAG: homoserine dehydrogenase [Chloroflexi bacterium]|nr:homoserine dehydrogenase [Chloroflexota bacterium]MCL5076492.1 homoserine dehydrogenase [Chloroflexota bacterium]